MAEDIRRRRAERVRQERAKTFVSRNRTYLLAGIVIIALVGVVVATPVGGYLNSALPKPSKYVHEHASFAWFANGQHVSFRDQAYDCNVGKYGCDLVHMHYYSASPETDQVDVLHIEGMYPGGQASWDLAKIFGQYGMVVTPTDVKFDTNANHGGVEYKNNGTSQWSLWVSKVVGTGRQPFQRIQGDWTTYVPREQDKLLLTYGDPNNATEIGQEQAAVPDAAEWTGSGAAMPGR